jgi:FkbM family methyltransferase
MKLFLPLLDNGQGDIKADFLDCFLNSFSGTEVHTVRFSDSHPGRARNRVASYFLRTDCTHLLFIDGDIKFNRHHIEMLAESDAPILGGIYCLKTIDEPKPCLQTLQGTGAQETGGYLAVARTGTGFLRISRTVFEQMAKNEISARYTNHGLEEWDFFASGVIDNEWLSEDWYFCDNARALGFQVLIDTRIQLLHRGEIDYPLKRDPDRLQLCPPEMKPHLERIWKGEYAIPLDTPPATVLDIGANIGAFSEWACEQWPNATIQAFEPHPDNATLYRLNTKHRANRIQFHEFGVRAAKGFHTLAEGGNAGEHSFHFSGEGKGVHCIDSATLRSAEFVKIDTEGCELEILQNLDLSATRAIALEYHSGADREAIRALLDTRNFAELAHEAVADGRGVLKFTLKP